MGKVFISVLGTNNYMETYYTLHTNEGEKKAPHPVHYIQEALIDFQCRDWTKEDKIYILCTHGKNGSYIKNWKDGGHGTETKGLESVLKSMSLRPTVTEVEIPAGFTEEEIWEIFNIMYGLLRKDDEIYFDATHSFRSIPMFITTLFNYSKYMLGTTVKSIHYGAFESLGSRPVVEKMPVEERIAPIIDLTNIVRLQEYTDAAYSLSKYGKMEIIGSQLKDGDKLNKIFDSFSKYVSELDEYIAVSKLHKIKSGKAISGIRNLKKALKRQHAPAPIEGLYNRLEKELREFSAEDCNQNIEAAINWASRFNMLPQAYTLAQEYIIGIISEGFSKINPFTGDKRKKQFRELCGSVLGIDDKSIASRDFKGHLRDNTTITDYLLSTDIIQKLRPYYSRLAENRNNINHAKQNEKSIAKLSSEFKSNYDDCLKILHEAKIQVDESILTPRTKGAKLLLNLSNHPIATWTEKQLIMATEKYGEPRDLEFPDIDPEMDTDMMENIMEKCLNQITEYSNTYEVTVHIMGEMVFVYNMVKRLKEKGFPCIASTTDRIVEMTDNGGKTSYFNFVKFREY